MWEESAEKPRPLRTGLTTGTCAVACCVASALRLLKEHVPETRYSDTPSVQKNIEKWSEKHIAEIISVTLPKGKNVELHVYSEKHSNICASAFTIKDAGDDPDVTHGAKIIVELHMRAEPGIAFFSGAGVGTVTREGLSLPVGEPAINPVPRQMITEHLDAVAAKYGYCGGFCVTIGVENGEAIAQKTMNSRLGIVGGLSILGTTGIVRPFSCSAWVASIHQGIDVARANGIHHIAASTGNGSEQAIKKKYQLCDMALIEMGDFAGAVLKHVKKTPIKKLSVCGGFGKVTKLANGHLDLNSRVSPIDFEHIAQVAGALGANHMLQHNIISANTSIEALTLCQQANIDLADAMCKRAVGKARSIVPATVSLEVFAINRQGEFVGYACDDARCESNQKESF